MNPVIPDTLPFPCSCGIAECEEPSSGGPPRAHVLEALTPTTAACPPSVTVRARAECAVACVRETLLCRRWGLGSIRARTESWGSHCPGEPGEAVGPCHANSHFSPFFYYLQTFDFVTRTYNSCISAAVLCTPQPHLPDVHVQVLGALSVVQTLTSAPRWACTPHGRRGGHCPASPPGPL